MFLLCELLIVLISAIEKIFKKGTMAMILLEMGIL